MYNQNQNRAWLEGAAVFVVLRQVNLWSAYKRSVGIENASLGGFQVWKGQMAELRKAQPLRNITATILAAILLAACVVVFFATLSSDSTSGGMSIIGGAVSLVVLGIAGAHVNPPAQLVQAVSAWHQAGRPHGFSVAALIERQQQARMPKPSSAPMMLALGVALAVFLASLVLLPAMLFWVAIAALIIAAMAGRHMTMPDITPVMQSPPPATPQQGAPPPPEPGPPSPPAPPSGPSAAPPRSGPLPVSDERAAAFLRESQKRLQRFAAEHQQRKGEPS